MADTFPVIKLRSSDQGAILGVAGQEFPSLAALLAQLPALGDPANAEGLARAANHLARGAAYSVIADPAGFADDYRNRLAAEDLSSGWQEGVYRLSDFGVPDFAMILPPACTATEVVFFARDRLTGLPYRATFGFADAMASYKALPLTPVERKAPVVQVVPPGTVGTQTTDSADATMAEPPNDTLPPDDDVTP